MVTNHPFTTFRNTNRIKYYDITASLDIFWKQAASNKHENLVTLHSILCTWHTLLSYSQGHLSICLLCLIFPFHFFSASTRTLLLCVNTGSQSQCAVRPLLCTAFTMDTETGEILMIVCLHLKGHKKRIDATMGTIKL